VEESGRLLVWVGVVVVVVVVMEDEEVEVGSWDLYNYDGGSGVL